LRRDILGFVVTTADAASRFWSTALIERVTSAKRAWPLTAAISWKLPPATQPMGAAMMQIGDVALLLS
jgi:hypothetical protein